MKNITKKGMGLAGLILTAGLTLNAQNASKKQDLPYVTGTSQETVYSNSKNNSNYQIEGHVLFNRKYGDGETDFFKINNDLEEGELEFTVYPSEFAKIKTSFSGKTSLDGKEYIPTRMITNKDSIAREFELTNLSAKLSSKIKNHSRKLSKNKFGYSYLIKSKDMKEMFPQINIMGQDYLYFNGTKGAFVINNKGKNQLMGPSPEAIENGFILPEIFIPLKDLDKVQFGVNPETGNLTIYSEEGFYIPTLESKQVNVKYAKK